MGHPASAGTNDAGTVTITVNGFSKSTNYGATSTASSLASALASAFNGDGNSPVTAGVAGGTISLTAKTSGAATNYSLSTSSATTQSGFTGTSFPVSTSGATLTGGDDGGSTFTTPYSVSLTFASNGDILTANDNVNGNWSYAYDDFNRLASASKTGAAYTYAYDRYGNRWQQNGPFTTLLTFSGGNNRIDGYCYDAAGNLLREGGCADNPYIYDAENRLISVSGSISYVYDGAGRRVRKTVSGTSVDFLYDRAGRVVAELSSSGGWNRGEVYAGERHLATYNNGTTYLNHADWLGTERARTGMTGAVTETCTSLPFGDGQSCIGAESSPHHFTGKERDSETGLDYFGIRYFGSSMGRFMSPDSIANDWELANPQTWNRYAYARNNPLIYVDPDGAAVELLGEEEQRMKELELLQKSVGNKDAANRLYINEVKDGDNTRYFVGIKGDVGDFMKLSETSHDLANVVQDKQVVEFGLTNKDLTQFGGAVTYDKGEAGNQNVRVLVNPDQMGVADRNLNPATILGYGRWAGQNQDPAWRVRPFTPGIATWHEFGHAWGNIHGREGHRSDQEANAWENRMRQQVYGPFGPDNAKRVAH